MTVNPDAAREDEVKTWLQVAYALYAVAPFVAGPTALIAVIIDYVKRDEAAGTWLASHYRWQIRTFWWGLLWAVVGAVLSLVVVGIFILIADFVWTLYRVIKGWIYLNDGKPMYAPQAEFAPAMTRSQ
jgi:uncharacterized membrane protein